MRRAVDPMLEQGRVVTDATYGTTAEAGLMGAFFVMAPTGAVLKILSSGPADVTDRFNRDWEHVSVSCDKRCPTWGEMAFVKDLFWDVEETVIQLHPPKSQYVNCHPFTLHLWKSPRPIKLPPSMLVGPK